jgi:hypothetical protein
LSENRAVYEIMWKNILEKGRPQMAIWHICIAFWIPKTTNTRSGCVKLIVFHSNGCTRASQCYFLRTLPLLLYFTPANAFTVAYLLCMFVPYDVFLQVFRPKFFISIYIFTWQFDTLLTLWAVKKSMIRDFVGETRRKEVTV